MSEPPVDRTSQSSLMRAFEQLAGQLVAGQAITAEYIQREFPDHAVELIELLPTMAALAQPVAALPSAQATNLLSLDISPADQLSLTDFRIIREVGRGGMGVVYEAEQLSLKRRVAVKILPFAGILDLRQLQRFKNEALAAAHLDHPHIVEVYAVGCENGIHFYAMRFVDGVTILEALEAQRCLLIPDTPTLDPQGTNSVVPEMSMAGPATQWNGSSQAALNTLTGDTAEHWFRRVAELGVEAAHALEHAHQMGVIHRDIKPSNLMVDERGKLWVTDFGLASNQSDATLTRTGDLLGTLRYMSPEQALAKRVTIDHRSDVYSLGATLYEMLTLAPAFPGQDREDTLRRIAFDDPTAPRKLNRQIPDDLETIVLKALEKRPEDRYGSAQELADDLQRYLQHEPIWATQPGIIRRVAKWSRRHRGWVIAGVTAMIASSTALLLGVILLGAAYRDSDRHRTAAELEAARADENLYHALSAIDQMLTRLASEQLLRIEGTVALRRQLLDESLTLCRNLQAQNISNAKLDVQIATTYQQLLILEYFESQRTKSTSQLAELEKEATPLLENLMERATHDPAIAVQLTEGLVNQFHRLNASTSIFFRNLRGNVDRLLGILENHPPTYDIIYSRLRCVSAFTYDDLRAVGVIRDVEQSEVWREPDLKLRRAMRDASIRIANNRQWNGLLPPKERQHAIDQRLATSRPISDETGDIDDIAITLNAYSDTGRAVSLADERQLLLAGVERGRRAILQEQQPKIAVPLMQLFWQLGDNYLLGTGDARTALVVFEEGNEISWPALQSLEFPQVHYMAVANLQESYGYTLELLGQHDEAMAHYQHAIQNWHQLQHLQPGGVAHPFWYAAVANVHMCYGAYLLQNGRRNEATEQWGAAMDLLAEGTSNIKYRDRFAYYDSQGSGTLADGLHLKKMLATTILLCPIPELLQARISEVRPLLETWESQGFPAAGYTHTIFTAPVVRAIYELRIGNTAAAVELLQNSPTSLFLAEGLAKLGRSAESLAICEKYFDEAVSRNWNYMYKKREADMQLVNVAAALNILASDPRLISPWRKKWASQPR